MLLPSCCYVLAINDAKIEWSTFLLCVPWPPWRGSFQWSAVDS